MRLVASRLCARGRASVMAFAVLTAVAAAEPAAASQLIAPAVGTPDSAMGGATVASPITVTAAAFSNPAGIMEMAPGSSSLAIALPNGHSHVEATTPLGTYDTTSDFLAYAPEGGYVGEFRSLRWGFAAYGSLGSTFQSRADPAVGLNSDFISSAGVSNFALMVAMPITSSLSVGAELIGVFGQSYLRFRFEPGDPTAFTVYGGGVQAMVGARYELSDKVALGLGIRTPGKMWAEGDDGVKPHQDVELELNLPAQVFVGANADLTSKLHVGLSARWSDTSSFGKNGYTFQTTKYYDTPFIKNASDEYRVAGAMAYDLTDTLTSRASVSYADDIVPDASVNPLIYDSAEWKIGAGLSWTHNDWTLDLAFGHSPTGERTIRAEDGSVLPGRYSLGGQIYMIGIRKSLGNPAPESQGS